VRGGLNPAPYGEGKTLIICEICGAANVEYDTECRICGHQFAQDQPEPSPVATGAHTAVANPAPVPPEPQAPKSDFPRAERMASMNQPPATTAPPMLRTSAFAEDTITPNPAARDLPTFMQTPGRTLSSPEAMQLISANDLPDWIRQIAEADAAKAESDAREAAAQAEVPAATVRTSIETEAKASGPSTHWLSKTAAATTELVDPWTVTESVAKADPQPIAQSAMAAYPTITPTPLYMPDEHDERQTKPRRELFRKPDRQPAPVVDRPAAAKASRKPIYRSLPVQLALLLCLAAILALLVL
jgi:hypothetical protein